MIIPIVAIIDPKTPAIDANFKLSNFLTNRAGIKAMMIIIAINHC